MSQTRHSSSVKGVAKALLSLLLAIQAISSLMNNPLMNAYSDDSVNYAGFRSVAEVRAAAEKNIALAKKAAMDALGGEPGPAANVKDRLVENTSEVHEAFSVSEAATAPLIEQRSQAVNPPPLEDPMVVTLADRSLDAKSLDGIRGGFDLDGGNLKYSFGIDRAVFINGELVAHTVLNLKDLQVAAGGSATLQQAPTGAAIGAVSVIQNGAGNVVGAQIGQNLAGTVIQNTLNNQKIQNVTTINAMVSSAQVMRAMSVQSAVQQGIVSSLRR